LGFRGTNVGARRTLFLHKRYMVLWESEAYWRKVVAAAILPSGCPGLSRLTSSRWIVWRRVKIGKKTRKSEKSVGISKRQGFNKMELATAGIYTEALENM